MTTAKMSSIWQRNATRLRPYVEYSRRILLTIIITYWRLTKQMPTFDVNGEPIITTGTIHRNHRLKFSADWLVSLATVVVSRWNTEALRLAVGCTKCRLPGIYQYPKIGIEKSLSIHFLSLTWISPMDGSHRQNDDTQFL